MSEKDLAPLAQDQQYGLSDVDVVADKPLFKKFFEMRELSAKHRLFEGGWGGTIVREVFVRGDAVGVLLYDPVNDLVGMIEQFRAGVHYSHKAQSGEVSPWVIELVAGLCDKDETPEQIAVREALEEACVTVQKLEAIADYFCSPGGSDEYFYSFCGLCDLSNAGGVHGLPEEGEDIRVHLFDAASLLQGKPTEVYNNAHNIVALQWLAVNRDRLRSEASAA